MELHVKDLEFYGGHGVFEEEVNLQGRFLVDVLMRWHLEAKFPISLSQTIDYQEVVTEVKKIMGHREALLENLAGKIYAALTGKYAQLSYCSIRITKWPQLGQKHGQISVCFDGK